jgi:hypothetical protein
VLTFQYTAQDCSATSHTQDDGKVECDDYAPLADSVFIRSTDKADPYDSGAKTWFEGLVAFDETFDMAAANEGDSHFGSASFIHIFDAAGDTLLQSVEFHTSCSQPLFLGNQFGASLLVGCIGEDALADVSGFDPVRRDVVASPGALEPIGATEAAGDTAEGNGFLLCEHEFAGEILSIQSETAILIVTGIDLAGNVNECQIDLCEFLASGEESVVVGGDANTPGGSGGVVCPEDVNFDGVVDVDDVVSIVMHWGPDSGSNPCDVNGDGTIDTDDIVMVVIRWGTCE